MRRLGALPSPTNPSTAGGTYRPYPGFSRYNNNSHRTITGRRPPTPRSPFFNRTVEGNNVFQQNNDVPLIQLNDLKGNTVSTNGHPIIGHHPNQEIIMYETLV